GGDCGVGHRRRALGTGESRGEPDEDNASRPHTDLPVGYFFLRALATPTPAAKTAAAPRTAAATFFRLATFASFPVTLSDTFFAALVTVFFAEAPASATFFLALVTALVTAFLVAFEIAMVCSIG